MKLNFKFKPAPAARMDPTPARLSDLPNGCSAVIAGMDASAEELMELGFVPGARITPAYGGLGGDPRVYELDGSLVALRRAAARHISVILPDQAKSEDE